MPAFPITTPTTVEEFRLIANAFSTGSRFAPGTPVYLVIGSSGAIAIIRVGAANAEHDVLDALQRPIAGDDPNSRKVYQVDVPRESRALARCVFDIHGGTFLSAMTQTDGANAPDDANLGDIQSMQLVVTWSRDRGTTVFSAATGADAIFITQGAVDTFALPTYSAMSGQRFVRALRQRMEMA